ncbi:integral membrane protein [Cadophora sp. DSE1049]|nr:integral membrane protein [Cadophora sp. DSE1049]
MGYISPIGRDWGATVNWDSLGKMYASIAIIWTFILALGSAWLIQNRRLPFLRMRNISLAITSVCFLHVYLVKILLAYTTNGHFLCSAEFWIMSIYLPFGIALFQGNMVQLLSLSTQQRKLLDSDRASIRERRRPGFSPRQMRSEWRSLTALQKTYFGIGIGMLLQVVVTAAIYGTNRKLQGHWGNIARPRGQALCRKGLEWVPSALWQLFWCCIYGPYLLYRIRNVHDAHYWRAQTILCVISGFPGAPLWFAAVFTPGKTWKWVNRYFVPPMWFVYCRLAPGIFMMQACTIFFPIYEAYHQHRINKTIASALQRWEDDKSWAEQGPDEQANTSMSPYKSNKMYTTAALEEVLLSNPAPLLRFAATKDFTAENILFLVAVRDWKAKWLQLGATPILDLKPEVKRRLWIEAVEIYAYGVSERYAEFPVNIEGSLRKTLDQMFAAAVEVLVKATNSTIEELDEDPYSTVTPFVTSPFTLPAGFGEGVFDAAEKSVKYLVVTNTWRKFVTAMREGDPRVSAGAFD